MAVSAINSASWYASRWTATASASSGSSSASLSGSASQIFGTSSASHVFAVNVSASASSSSTVGANDAILKGLQDEIDRTQGFRTDLTVAEKNQLADYQAKISDIEANANTRALTDEEIKQRAEYYAKSYEILGKKYTDVSNDSLVQENLTSIDDLLASKPEGADATRLASLKKIETTLTDQINSAGENGASETTSKRLIEVKKQIYNLTAPRQFTDLSIAERKQYDEYAKAINDHLGYEYQLTSDKRLKIERLQTTIDTLSSGSGTSSPALDMLA